MILYRGAENQREKGKMGRKERKGVVEKLVA